MAFMVSIATFCFHENTGILAGAFPYQGKLHIRLSKVDVSHSPDALRVWTRIVESCKRSDDCYGPKDGNYYGKVELTKGDWEWLLLAQSRKNLSTT